MNEDEPIVPTSAGEDDETTVKKDEDDSEFDPKKIIDEEVLDVDEELLDDGTAHW